MNKDLLYVTSLDKKALLLKEKKQENNTKVILSLLVFLRL